MPTGVRLLCKSGSVVEGKDGRKKEKRDGQSSPTAN